MAGAGIGRIGLAVVLAFPASFAKAQTSDPFAGPMGDTLPSPSITGPTLPPPSPAESEAELTVSAGLAGQAQPLNSGLVWRIYEDRGDAEKPAILARSNDPVGHFKLLPGTYVATVSYGYASASKRVTMSGQPLTEQLKLSAGALKLSGAIGTDPIAPAQLAFSIFVPIGTNSEGRLVRSAVKVGELVRLPEGTYHVVSTYGDSNAIQRADLKVENGKVTDATLNHRAATLTLKLVAAPGTEAFAGTAFSVLTPGGDTIREAIGAFPSVTLAEGDYMLIARHDGQVYTREFKVESGRNQDVEVVAKGS